MHFTYRNVNDAFDGLVSYFDTASGLVTVPTRNGDCFMIPEPVTITYQKPLERVLLNKARDANPFFHVFESLWMLSGSNRLAPLQKYVSTFGDFSDDGETLNGAYGYRWRHAFNKPPASRTGGEFEGKDQLKILIKHLKENPTSRRAVLQMWNVDDDLLKLDTSKDVCCNTAVYFSIREVEYEDEESIGKEDFYVYGGEKKVLDMTVTNRSNDLIWGTLGANAVHMSFLQEYMANCIGAEVGVYNQFSNNLHAYKERFEPEKWLESHDEEVKDYPWHVPLVSSQEVFDEEVKEFVDMDFVSERERVWKEPFLETVAKPLMMAFASHKAREYVQAFSWLNRCESFDWFMAGHDWLKTREQNWRKNA
jgi:thymidylate synthase|tara:strand:- start:4336 stop:5430 length:1095 start_codon:yes stop_codon:yes gene_type:complete